MQLSVRDAAAILSVSEKTIYRWINHNAMPAYQVNEQYRFNRAELLEWATEQKIQIRPEAFLEAEASPSPLPNIADAIAAGGVCHNLGGKDKQAVLRAVVAAMRLPEGVDREFLFQVLLARETLGSTAVGDGIAIPHVRNPIVLHMTQPILTLCFLADPIEFGAQDHHPVHTLFTLISPTVRVHLHMLSRLAYMLRNPHFKAAVMGKASQIDLLKAARQAESELISEGKRA